MRCDRRNWLRWTAAAATGSVLGRPPRALEAHQGSGGQAQPVLPLPPSIARIEDISVDERIEPALVFVARLP